MREQMNKQVVSIPRRGGDLELEAVGLKVQAGMRAEGV